jgi:hypothetical protein
MKFLLDTIGKDVLSQHVLEIDFPAKRVRLHPIAGAPELRKAFARSMVRLPFDEIAGGLIRIEAKLDGGDAIPGVLDLGAPNSVANAKAGVGAARIAKANAIGADGKPVPADVCRLRSFELAGKSIAGPTMVVADLPVFATLGLADRPAMLVGLDLLATRVLAIDYGQGAIYVSR